MKFIVNEHNYQGFGGETTDYMGIFEDFTKATSAYEYSKEKFCNYQDSFVQLYAVDKYPVLLRAYYSNRYADSNPFERGRFFDGEYVNEELIEEYSKAN